MAATFTRLKNLDTSPDGISDQYFQYQTTNQFYGPKNRIIGEGDTNFDQLAKYSYRKDRQEELHNKLKRIYKSINKEPGPDATAEAGAAHARGVLARLQDRPGRRSRRGRPKDAFVPRAVRRLGVGDV